MFIYIDDLHYKNVSSFYQLFYLKVRRIILKLVDCLATAPIAYQTSGPLPTISQHRFAIALRVSFISVAALPVCTAMTKALALFVLRRKYES